MRRSIRRKHTLPNYKIRFKPFFEPVYNQKLYSSQIDKLMRENSSKSETISTKSEENKKLDPKDDKSSNQNLQYTKLCEKLGFDLASVGQLHIQLKTCDRLPEALYSINLNQAQTALPVKTADQTTQPVISPVQAVNPVEPKDACQIYLTTSVDSVSMENLMEKRICKENWPFIEFEIQKTTLNQNIGINFVETYFINKTEVCIQKIFPNSIASLINNIKVYDIVYSLNQTRISSLKQLNKLIQKFATSPLKFLVQRPCVLVNNQILTSTAPNRTISMQEDEQIASLAQTNQKVEFSTPNQSEFDNLPSSSQSTKTAQVLPLPSTSNPSVTHTASASCLVEYFCSVSECISVSFSFNLNII